MPEGTKRTIIKWLPFLTFLLFGLPLLLVPFGNGDELWNFNFAMNIANGKLPYRDFNMVQTPLSAYVSALFLLLFGKELLVFRVLGVLLLAVVFALLYAVCRSVFGNQVLAFVAVIFTYVLVYHLWIYDYNHLNLLVVLLIMWLELHEDENVKLQYVIALLYGVVPVIKQSTGSVFLAVFWITMIVDFVRFKEKRILVLRRVLLSLIPGILFGYYLVVIGAFPAFWDYAVKGVFAFTHRKYLWEYGGSNPIAFLICLFILMTLILSTVCIMKGKGNVSRRNHIRLLGICVSAGVVAYPLTDHVHMMTALVPYVVCFLCCIRPRKLTGKESVSCLLVGIALIFVSALYVIPSAGKYKTCELKHFRRILIDEGVEDKIIEIDNYILRKEAEGNRVVMADECAASFMIPIDRYTPNFDMLLVGNIGTRGVENLLQDTKGAIYLVFRDESRMGYQSHFELIHYIKENYEKVDEVLNIDVYREKEDNREVY